MTAEQWAKILAETGRTVGAEHVRALLELSDEDWVGEKWRPWLRQRSDSFPISPNAEDKHLVPDTGFVYWLCEMKDWSWSTGRNSDRFRGLPAELYEQLSRARIRPETSGKLYHVQRHVVRPPFDLQASITAWVDLLEALKNG